MENSRLERQSLSGAALVNSSFQKRKRGSTDSVHDGDDEDDDCIILDSDNDVHSRHTISKPQTSEDEDEEEGWQAVTQYRPPKRSRTSAGTSRVKEIEVLVLSSD